MARPHSVSLFAFRHAPVFSGLAVGLLVALAGTLSLPGWVLAAGGGLAAFALASVLRTGDATPPGAEAPGSRALIEPGQRFAVLEALNDPVFVVDARLAILCANRAAQALFGSALIGDSLTQFLRQPAVSELAERVMAEGHEDSAEIQLLHPFERIYLMHAALLPPGPGLREGKQMVVSLRDITQARLAERMRVDFVANASHELRTPLATLVGFIETLQGSAANDAEARTRFLAIMANEAGRMARLIDDLLSLSRIELDKGKRPSQRLDLRPLLGDVGNTLGMRLDKDERRIVLAIQPDLPPVLADRDQMIQVVHNLVSNALKYGRTGTPIEVGARVDPAEGVVRIWVADQGEGVSAEHLPRLTERFYRVDTARSRSLGGTGLGLAIVKHIVERHGGRLSIASQIGKGTTVSFTLPL